jgi:CRP-like cAMP-binding protein
VEPTFPILDALDADARRSLLASTRRRKFARGETIFHEGDPGDSLHLVDKGRIAIRVTTPMGEVATLTVVGPGDAMGEGALLAPDSRRTASAVPLEPTETRVLHRDDFASLRREHPVISELLVLALAAQVRRLSSHLVEALYVDSDRRVLRRLAMLAGDQAGIDLPITQDDLATMAGTTRPTANRVLKSVEEAGVIALRRGHITVLDPDALARHAR